MNILNIDFSDTFQESFTHVGSHQTECNCGRTHFCIDSYGFEEYSHEEKEEIIESSLTDEKMIIHYDVDHVSVLEISGVPFVEDCECGGFRPYMNFVIQNRQDIATFLVKFGQRLEDAIEQEKIFKILKDTTLDSPFKI